MTLHDLGGLQLTYRTTGCNGSCFQQDFHYPSSHRGWILAVRIQVTEKLLDYQVWVLGLKEKQQKTEEIIDLSWKKEKYRKEKKRVREKVTENCCIEVIHLIKWQTKNWILVIKCITPFAFFIQAQNEPQLWANRLKPKLKSVRTSWILKHISSLHH